MTTRRLRLAFFGTPDFALPTLHSLQAGPHELVVVVSQPDRKRGRGQRRCPGPVAAAARDAGLPLLQPERIGDAQSLAALAEFAPDLGVVVAFGQFLPRQARELPSIGYCINGHASLLPRHRGAAPIAHALLAGDAETGVSIMRVEQELDAGPVALVRRLQIAADENAGALHTRLAALTAEAMAAAVARCARGALQFSAQDHARATLAPKLEREDARLDFSQPAPALARRVRALAPRPGAFTTLGDETLRVLAATAEASGGDDGKVEIRPGLIRREGSVLRIACGEGWLLPQKLQRAGARALATADFLRGRPLLDGAQLGVGAGN